MVILVYSTRIRGVEGGNRVHLTTKEGGAEGGNRVQLTNKDRGEEDAFLVSQGFSISIFNTGQLKLL